MLDRTSNVERLTDNVKATTANFVKALRKAIRDGVLEGTEDGGPGRLPEDPGDDRGQPGSAESAKAPEEDFSAAIEGGRAEPDIFAGDSLDG